jgi:hypothetical protein
MDASFIDLLSLVIGPIINTKNNNITAVLAKEAGQVTSNKNLNIEIKLIEIKPTKK